MSENQCVICGKELPLDLTVLILTLPNKKYATCCLCHEGSEELSNYVSQFIGPSELSKHGGTVYIKE